MRKCFLLLGLCAINMLVFAQEKPVAFKGALIYPISGEPIPNGVLIVHKGKVASVGGAGTAIPRDATVHNVEGKIILPGLVDSHSHLGGPEGGDASAALNPDTRAMDAVTPTSDGFKKAVAGGITTINVMPGSGHLMSGQTIYVKMREARVIEDLLITNSRGVFGGLKMANGTNSMRATPGFPGTRSKSAAMMRELFVKAVEYKKKLEKPGKDTMQRDLRLEPLVEVLNGKRIVHFHTHKLNDILTAIRLSKEFGLRTVLHHVSEAWKVADEIAEAKMPCSIIILESPGGKFETIEFSNTNGAALDKAGALVALHTDDGITDSRLFLRSAAQMVKAGLSREKALEAVTIAGAKMLDLESRVGSLSTGKDADFIILSGDPFSVYTKVEQTWVEGMKRFDLARPEDRAMLYGGYQVYLPDRGEYHHHHDDE